VVKNRHFDPMAKLFSEPPENLSNTLTKWLYRYDAGLIKMGAETRTIYRKKLHT
jgi:hypothetical protein